MTAPEPVQLPDAVSVDVLLAVLGPVMKAVTEAVGPHCEAVLHDLSRPDAASTVVAIENGHVTGRSVGSPSTSKGLEFKMNSPFGHDEYGYRGTTRSGRELRCSSVFIRDQAGRLMANLCINVDQTPMRDAWAALEAMSPSSATARSDDEVFAADVNELLDVLFDRAVGAIGRPVSEFSKEDRIAVVKHLEARGIFYIKNAASTVSTRLGISRGALYNYLDQGRGHQA
jgi:predicted transcriptional regulator YheO